MEKILKFLPKAAQAVVSVQNYQFSPTRESKSDVKGYKFRSHFKKGFSGPMIPAEARVKSNKDFDTQEPTSPKISCMGQIKNKHKNKMCKKKPKEFKPVHLQHDTPLQDFKKKPSGITKIFGRRKSDSSIDHREPDAAAPTLIQLRNFASKSDTLENFDWKNAQIYSDEENEDDVDITFSAPILGLELEPRKEINLWKRRTMPKPKPLQLDMVRSQ